MFSTVKESSTPIVTSRCVRSSFAEVLSERFRQESETLRNASLKLMEDHERRRRKLRLASKDPDAEVRSWRAVTEKVCV